MPKSTSIADYVEASRELKVGVVAIPETPAGPVVMDFELADRSL